ALDESLGGRAESVDSAWLKLMQFVAARPKLAKDLATYAGSRRNRERQNYSLMPRGYLGDTSHDGAINYLVVSGALVRVKAGLSRSNHDHTLDTLFETIQSQRLFLSERDIISSLQQIKPSKALLGGR